MTTDYRDSTALTDAQKSSLVGLATAIRTKMYGKDVREAIASGLELAGTSAGSSFTPNGVVGNVSELNTEYPSGTNGIFVNSSDGYWYYWNGSAWAKGGDFIEGKEDFSTVDVDGINLLKGTSSSQIAVTMSDYGIASTASNSSALTSEALEAGKEYSYSIEIDKLPSNPILMEIIAFKTDGTTAFHYYQNIATTGRHSLIFTMPDVDYNYARVDIAFQTEHVGTTDAAIISNEALTRGKYVYPWFANPGDVSAPVGFEILSIILRLNKVLPRIHKYQSNINLISGTTDNLQPISATGYGNLSAAQNSGYLFSNFIKGYFYNYSVEVSNINKNTPMLLVIRGLKSDLTEAWHKYGISFTDNGRYNISFQAPSDSDYDFISMSVGFKTNQSVTYTINVGRENLSILNYDPGYSYSYDILSLRDIEEALNNFLFENSKDQTKINNLPLVNLLQGTSDTQRTLSMSGWGNVTTSTNALQFTDFIKGLTYCYQVNITNLLSAPISLEAKGVKSGGVAWIFHKNVISSGTNALIFTVPNDDIDFISVSVVFQSSQSLTYEITLSQEKLSISQFKNDYTPQPSSNFNADRQVDGILINKINDLNYFANLLPVINVQGNWKPMVYSNTKSVLPFTFYRGGQKMIGYAEMEWQGDSSLSFPQKNFKFKTYLDSNKSTKLCWRPKPSMYSNSSFTLKSYYSDTTLIRDETAAEIYSWFIANNATAPDRLLRSNHFGTIQSVPAALCFDGNFYGLVMINTKSSSQLWNMDESDANQIALESEQENDICAWISGTPTLGTDFELQSDNNTNAASALQTLSTNLTGVNGDAFKTNISNLFDLNSLADFYIFNFLIGNVDCWFGKNQNYLTYDSKKWYLMSYDFNASMMQSPTPGTINNFDDPFNTIHNRLIYNYANLMTSSLQSRYSDLESKGVFNMHRWCQVVGQKSNEIPFEAYQANQLQWPSNPSYNEKIGLDDINYMFMLRKQMLDAKVASGDFSNAQS